jgi:uncharacterized ferritin-like protein (DUF455 family)
LLVGVKLIAAVDTKCVRGVELRRDPAREEAFHVVHLHKDMADAPGMSEGAQRQRLHKHMHNEMQNLEIVALSLSQFPQAPWGLRLSLARQCWDEARHAEIFRRRLEDTGGFKGEFPVMNYEWGVSGMMTTLEGRLALQNRTFEAAEIDLLGRIMQYWREIGDNETALTVDAVIADEIQHVRYANHWLRVLARADPRVLLEVAKAVDYLKKVTAALAPEAGEVNAAGTSLTDWRHEATLTNVPDRLLAEFSEREVGELVRDEISGVSSPASAAAAQ